MHTFGFFSFLPAAAFFGLFGFLAAGFFLTTVAANGAERRERERTRLVVSSICESGIKTNQNKSQSTRSKQWTPTLLHLLLRLQSGLARLGDLERARGALALAVLQLLSGDGALQRKLDLGVHLVDVASDLVVRLDVLRDRLTRRAATLGEGLDGSDHHVIVARVRGDLLLSLRLSRGLALGWSLRWGRGWSGLSHFDGSGLGLGRVVE